jgi:hypothetical protein
LVEVKSPARPLRRGDLIRRLGDGAQYHAEHVARLDQVGRAEQDEVLVPLVEAKLARQEGGEAWGWWQTRLLGPQAAKKPKKQRPKASH